MQKCVRAGGKHNDLDEIGRTARHLTFFEMLGNFSFGDYFKRDAIVWAWEFVTEVLQLDPDRLWVTVHVSDDEAETIWREEIGLDPHRIQRLDDDNFWRMGDVGPCGPSSEIFYDKGPAHGADGGPATGGEDRFVEFWNLVFMQFEQHDDGTQTPLPKPSIDTGLGLERTVSLLQGVDSVWETDELAALLEVASRLTGVAVSGDDAASEQQVSLRILADHARSTSLLVSDGVFPSNEARGYVLRRILRRAVRHAYILGVEEPIMAGDGRRRRRGDGRCLPRRPCATTTSSATSSTVKRCGSARRSVRGRRSSTNASTSSTPASRSPARSRSCSTTPTASRSRSPRRSPPSAVSRVDVDGFRSEMAEQQRRAKEARKVAVAGDVGHLAELVEQFGETEFTGREHSSTTGHVLYVDDDIVVLDRTPFYAESGGQIGDTGTITTESGTATVADTVIGTPGPHRAPDRRGSTARSRSVRRPPRRSTSNAGPRSAATTPVPTCSTGRCAPCWATTSSSRARGWGPIDCGSTSATTRRSLPSRSRRSKTSSTARSSATPRVGTSRPRWTRPSTWEPSPSSATSTATSYACSKRAPNSIELCGGTHVRALGDIGPLRIVSEGSIGSNIRRVEAVTGMATVELLRESEAKLGAAAAAVGVPVDELVDGIERRQAEQKELRVRGGPAQATARRRSGRRRSPPRPSTASSWLESTVVDRDGLRDLATSLRDQPGVEAGRARRGARRLGAWRSWPRSPPTRRCWPGP